MVVLYLYPVTVDLSMQNFFVITFSLQKNFFFLIITSSFVLCLGHCESPSGVPDEADRRECVHLRAEGGTKLPGGPQSHEGSG